MYFPGFYSCIQSFPDILCSLNLFPSIFYRKICTLTPMLKKKKFKTRPLVQFDQIFHVAPDLKQFQFPSTLYISVEFLRLRSFYFYSLSAILVLFTHKSIIIRTTFCSYINNILMKKSRKRTEVDLFLNGAPHCQCGKAWFALSFRTISKFFNFEISSLCRYIGTYKLFFIILRRAHLYARSRKSPSQNTRQKHKFFWRGKIPPMLIRNHPP